VNGNNANCIDAQAIIASTARVLGEVTIDHDVVIHDFVTVYPNVRIEANAEIFEGAVLGKPPTAALGLERKVVPGLKTTRVGKDCAISPHSVIYTDVEIGDGTLIGDNASVREHCRIGMRCVIGRNVTVNYNTVIGDFTKVMDSAHITGNTRIGSHVFISMLVVTSNDNYFGLKGYDDSFVQGPVIEDRVRIGAGANILPGVRLGSDSVVGAGAVVTRDVPSRKLVMGLPARIVRDVR
jgi:acetyltransferase-like isoleucine patch superfamily enzyme